MLKRSLMFLFCFLLSVDINLIIAKFAVQLCSKAVSTTPLCLNCRLCVYFRLAKISSSFEVNTKLVCRIYFRLFSQTRYLCQYRSTVVAKGDAREVGDRELELFQICQSTSLPGLSVIFFR